MFVSAGGAIMEERRQTTQAIAWFWDLYRRGLLELDPPYQRRSVWTQSYKDYFVDTILLAYPAPAIFLFEDIDEDGVSEYSVVDGQQRLTTIFQFLENQYPVSESASMTRLRGLYFADLPPQTKRAFYSYQFSIEFLPSTDEGTLNNIFDRINRNVSRLTAQELRHAKYSGVFANKVEELSEFLGEQLPKDFPRITAASRRQMKDVELVAQLLLLTERGVETYSQHDLDRAYSERDEEWDAALTTEQDFRRVSVKLSEWAEGLLGGEARRLRNQADFYALYGAVLDLLHKNDLPSTVQAVQRMNAFMAVVVDDNLRVRDTEANRYYDAARSASNDVAQRRERIRILTDVLAGEHDGVPA
jgi:Protein of unknown function DUF262